MKKTEVILLAGVILILGFVGFVLVAGVGDDNKESDESSSSVNNNESYSGSESSDDHADHEMSYVNIDDFSYQPQSITIKAGTMVRWKNQDSQEHDIKSDDGKFESSKLLSKGEVYEYTFEEPGVYDYHCSPHPYMTGTVIVEQSVPQ